MVVIRQIATRFGSSCNVLLVGFCLAGAGCTSIYTQTQPMLPADPCAQLKIRLAEARHAGDVVFGAGGKLRDHLKRNSSAETIQTDFDRLEMSAFDLQRRTNEARDVSRSCEQQPQFVNEIDRLDANASAWLNYVHTSRQAGASAQMQQLDDLFRILAAPAGKRTKSGQK